MGPFGPAASAAPSASGVLVPGHVRCGLDRVILDARQRASPTGGGSGTDIGGATAASCTPSATGSRTHCGTSSESCATATRAITASCACDRRRRRAPVSRTLRLPVTKSPWSWPGSGSPGRPEASCWMRRATCIRRQSAGCCSPGVTGATRRRARRSSIRSPTVASTTTWSGHAASPDELFHQAISSLLLEWAEAQHTSPNTIYVVGESWSGRAFELREVLERCAIPALVLPGGLGTTGAPFVAEAGEGAELPIVAFPDGTVLTNPSNVELAKAIGLAGEPRADGFRPRDRRAPGRRVSRQPSMAPRRDSAPWSSTRAGSGVRRPPAR